MRLLLSGARYCRLAVAINRRSLSYRVIRAASTC
jgi:hypothetical protein